MRVFIVTCIILLTAAAAQAAMMAPPMPPTSTGMPPCWPPPCIPIDGGITFLAVAGAALAGKKFYDNRKKKNTEQGI